MADEFRFYYGCASGSARKALRKMEEPNVMISHATANNTPFQTIENLFTDSGGYSQLHTHREYQSSDRQYLSYLKEYEPELFALRDYPCEPGLLWKLNRTVRDHQQRTTRHHRKLLDTYNNADIGSEPVAVLQGWKPEQYLSHLDELREEGVLTQYVAIGSLSNRNPETAAQIIHKIRNALSSKHRLHAFGIGTDTLQLPRVIESLDSADSAAYDFRTRMREPRQTWRQQVYHYLSMKRQIKSWRQKSKCQQSLLQSLQQ
ncbi:deazapurine DNA modification protein DpdA family protein [Halopiger aswanensis]|uniref:DeoxyPurine in DNA protein A domain-containing protein n=1 Tax=Halopiger aswanensis TaxID=148449 RepID=A0A419WJJ4_9EURY|nr:hypothetical protein [Halopiger aswanensis]RKD95629.1 hypothetical protein ATJ93_2490 [Halopiger aswanensis]